MRYAPIFLAMKFPQKIVLLLSIGFLMLFCLITVQNRKPFQLYINNDNSKYVAPPPPFLHDISSKEDQHKVNLARDQLTPDKILRPLYRISEPSRSKPDKELLNTIIANARTIPTEVSQKYLETTKNIHEKSIPSIDVQYRYGKLEFLPFKDTHCINTLPVNTFGNSDLPINIPPDNALDQADAQTIKCLYHRYVTTRQTVCREIPQLGNGDLKDNGWHICLDTPYIPVTNSCLVYSFYDTNENTEFSRHVQQQLGCHIHRFYPTETSFSPIKHVTDHVGQLPSQSSSRRIPQKFLSSWKHTLGDEDKIIDILTIKTDYMTLLSLVESPDIKRVRQLATTITAPLKYTSKDQYKILLNILRKLWEIRFRIYHYERKVGDGCMKDIKLRTAFPNCYVLYMINVDIRHHDTINEKTNKVLPSAEDVKNMTVDELQTAYHRFIQSIHYGCREIIRAGNLRDGGWEICHDSNIRPRYPCIVYSFGINNDFSFDDDVSQTYGCETHSFDPSMHKPDHRRSKNIWFHALGLSGKETDEGGKHRNWKMRKLSTIMQQLNHTNSRIDILKMDIEESEWSALSQMLKEGSLNNVAQLMVEFHGKGDNAETIHVLKRLYEHGFRIFWTSGNEMCQYKTVTGSYSMCNEVYFVNLRYV